MLVNISSYKKIIIVGNSCSGKTTLCKKLGEQLGLPYFDLDDFHWLPQWVKRPKNEMVAKVQNEILSETQWIVCGNYTRIMENVTWSEANVIIWLKYSKWLCLWRCLKRSLKLCLTKRAHCNGNYTNFRHAFFTWNHENLFIWIYTQHQIRNAKYESWQHNKFADKKWLVFERPGKLDAVEFV